MNFHPASLFTIFCAVLLSACQILPDKPPLTESYGAVPTTEGALAAAHANLLLLLAEGESAFKMLPAARDALAWRLVLIDSAERSIDSQYFLWHDDAAGSLVMNHLFAAADRGVHVRMLVDDMHLVTVNFFKGNDAELAAVDHHPNLELRLFNPGKYRRGTFGAMESMMADSQHYNRRMHNKMLLVDGHFAIVGGRNIGDEYFGLAEEFNFVDLDVVVAGDVIPQLTATFDDYWNSVLTYPAGALAEVDQEDYLDMREENRAYVEEQSGRLAQFAGLDREAMLDGLRDTMHRGWAEFHADRPIPRGVEEIRLYERLADKAAPGSDSHTATTTAPYLLPSQLFMDLVGQDIEQGLEFRLLTNSLATNNQPAVHSHYEKYRNRFLDMGIALYELHHQPQGTLRMYADTPPVAADFIALHLKASVIDDGRCFVGTLNLDHRSIDINTEDILYVESSGLCSELQEYLSILFEPDASWRVTRDEQGKLHWTSFEGTVDRQPARKTSQRLMDSIYRLVPEDQL